MSDAVKQILATGQPLSARYKNLGYRNRNMIPPPTHLLALIMGFPSTGKTHWLLSCPNAFIFNLDCSSTTYPNPPALIWPGIDSVTGSPIEPDEQGYDRKVDLTWGSVVEKVDLLMEWAKSDEPGRPLLVAFDTLGSTIPLIKDWVVQNATKLAVSKEPKEIWNELYGPSAWTEVANEFMSQVGRLRRAGYGVFVMDHITIKTIEHDNGSIEVQAVPSGGTPLIYKALYSKCEMVAAIETFDKSIRQTVPARKTAGGKIVRQAVVRQGTVRARRLVIDSSEDRMKHVLKHRVTIKRPVELPTVDPWDAFATIYKEAAEFVLKQPPTPTIDPDPNPDLEPKK